MNGLGFRGPTELERVPLAFESNIPSETKWALTVAIRVSNSNPSSLNFKENPWILPNLISHLDCTVYGGSTNSDNPDIQLCLNASITLRNLLQDSENAQIIAAHPSMGYVKQCIVRMVENHHLYNSIAIDELYESSKELLRYALDIAESVSGFISPAPKDDLLFISTMRILETTNDRFLTVTILRILSRLMVNTSINEPNVADNVTECVLDKVASFVVLSSASKDVLNDDLVLGSLDFLHQFCLPGGARVERVLRSSERRAILKDFIPRLLTYNCKWDTEFTGSELPTLKLLQRVRTQQPKAAPFLKAHTDLFSEIDSLNEPARATAWMRSCYYAVEDGEVTQISLWKSYEAQFGETSSQKAKRLLPAVDFIKNVNNAFPFSSAMVINLDNGQKRFIIKGILPRQYPISITRGDFEALKQPPVKSSGDEEQGKKRARQQPIRIFNYGDNDSISLNEINISASLLLNTLVSNDKGLFKGDLTFLLEQVMKVPKLLDYASEALNLLEY